MKLLNLSSNLIDGKLNLTGIKNDNLVLDLSNNFYEDKPIINGIKLKTLILNQNNFQINPLYNV